MSQPTATYVREFIMDDGNKPDFVYGKAYEVNSAFIDDDGSEVIGILTESGEVHHFELNDDWFSECFVILGDLSLVGLD